MYLQSIHRMNQSELEILSTSLDGAIPLHVEWLAKANRAILFNQSPANKAHTNPLPLGQCPFALWYDNHSIRALNDDAVFQKLTQLHKDFHVLVDQMISAEVDALEPSVYERFSHLQYEFFLALQRASHNCTEAKSGNDTLTGLPNNQGMKKILAQEQNRIERSNRESAIAVLNIDEYPELDQSFGAMSKDLLLIQVSQLLSASLRNFDLLGRFGDDGFLLCFPETDIATARDIVLRLVTTLAKTALEVSADQYSKLKFSVGTSVITREQNAELAIQYACRDLQVIQEAEPEAAEA